MRLCLVEDNAVAGLEPLTLTRPAFDLLLGASTLGRQDRPGPGRRAGAGPARGGDPAVPGGRSSGSATRTRRSTTATGWPAGRSSWPTPAGSPRPTSPPPDRRRPWLGLCDGQPACALVGPEQAVGPGARRRRRLVRRRWRRGLGASSWGASGSTAPGTSSPRTPRTWSATSPPSGRCGVSNRHLATARPGRPGRAALRSTRRPGSTRTRSSTPPTGRSPSSAGRGRAAVHAGRGALLHRPRHPALPRQPPRRRDARAELPHRRRGRGRRSSTATSNKYHEGFLGHAYVGEWVNLGAITSNSDLRNDYGEVFVPLGGDPVATGQAKVGCFLGDHTRTGLGSMLNTGTADRRDVQRAAGRPAAAEARPVVRGGPLRPGGPRVPAWSRCSPRRGSSWAGAGRSSPTSRSSSTATSTSRPAWSASAPSRRPTTAAATPGRSRRPRGSEARPHRRWPMSDGR